MAFGIRHRRECRPVSVSCRKEVHEIAVGGIAHRELARRFIEVGPLYLAVLTHGDFLLVAGKILVDMDTVGFHGGNDSVQALHTVDTALIVLVGASGSLVAVVVAETFHEVEAITVDIVCRHPVFYGIGPLLLHKGIALVPVVEHTVFMRGSLIVERIGGGRIHLIPGVQPV